MPREPHGRSTSRSTRPGGAGKLHKPIVIQTDDPGQPNVRFSIEGEIRLRFAISPARSVNFGAPNRSKPAKRTVTITSNLDEPVDLHAPRVDSKSLKADLKTIEVGHKYALTVETVPPLPEGALRSKVILATGLKEMPELAVYVYGYVRPRIVLQPTTLLVPQPLEEPFHRRITLKSNDGTPIHVTGVEPSSKDVHVEVDRLAEGSEYQIWITVPAEAALPPAGATVTVSTDSPQHPTFIARLRPFRFGRRLHRPSRTPATQPSMLPASGERIRLRTLHRPGPATQGR